MKVTHEDKDFYAVYNAPKDVRAYLKLSVPHMHRRYEAEPVPRWLVLDRYVTSTISLCVGSGTSVQATVPSVELYKELQAMCEDTKLLTVTLKSDSSPYAVLFLTEGAPDFMIEAAWKALVKQHHPDRGGDPDYFMRLKQAYEELKQRAEVNG